MNLYNESQHTRAHEAIVNYFQQLADPLNHQPGPIPDAVCIPFALKSISYAKSLSIPTSVTGLNGMFVFIPGSDRPTIRHYGYDPLVGRHNLIEVILPTEEIGDNYDYYRHVQTGLFMVANTVNGGAFAVQGVLNAIAFGSLFPIRTTPPEAISQYKDTNYNVITSVPVSDGVVAIPPLTDEFKFKRLRGINLRTPVSSTGDVASFYTEQAQELGNFHYKPTASRNITLPAAGGTLNLIEILMPEPAPWGAIEVTGNVLLQAFSSAVPVYAQLDIYRASANTVTYAEQILPLETCISTVTAYNLAGAGVQASIPFCYKGNYYDQEITRIVITVRQFTGVAVTATLSLETDVCVQLNDDYILAQRGSGVAISYQSLTEIQVSIAGKSTFELIPNAALSRNLPIGYNVEVPGVAEIARDSYIRQLGNPLRCVYTAQEYANVASKYIQRQTSEDIAVRAGTISRALYNALNSAAPYLIRGAGAAVGGLTGNPMLGRAVGSIGMGLYSGMTGQGKNVVMQNSVKQSDVMRCSTVDEKFDAMFARMAKLEEENTRLRNIVANTKVQTSHQPVTPSKASYDLTSWPGRSKQAILVHQQNIEKYRQYKGFMVSQSNVIVLPTIGLGKFDPLSHVRMTDWAKRDYSASAQILEDAGAIYTRFIGVLGGLAFDGGMIASTKPLIDLLNAHPTYEQIGSFQVDTRISADPFLIKLLQYDSPLKQMRPGATTYISMTYNGTIEGEITGTSWHLSAWTLFFLLSSNSYYTGSKTENLDPADLIVKMEHAANTNTKLYITTNFGAEDIDYDPIVSSEYFSDIKVAVAGGPKNFVAVGFNNHDVSGWYLLITLVMLTNAAGGNKVSAISELGMQDSKKSSTSSVINHGRYKSKQDMEDNVLANNPGPYEDYVVSLGDQGRNWFQALQHQVRMQNYDKINNLLTQAEPWMLKQERGKKVIKTQVSKKQATQHKTRTVLSHLKPKPKIEVSDDDGGFD